MGKIQRLDIQTANRIAAGEVVERPASVIKELCDNSLDAGASIISIEIENGGIQQMRVTDNGMGMDEDDARLAFAAHATSKLVSITDLDSLVTMGFRGEALASIASVSKIELITRQKGTDHALKLELEAGEVINTSVLGAPVGTSICVTNLFFNTPARYKFLKKDTTEAAKIVEVVERLALSRPDVSFKFIQNGKVTLHTPGNNDLNSAVFAVFGSKIAQDLIPIKGSDDNILQIEGLIGQPGAARNSRAWQLIFVNQRPIKSPIIAHAIDEAYRGRLMKGKHPFALIKLQLPQNLVDINVHPQKLEVRFWDQNEVYRTVYRCLKLALEDHVLPPGDWSSLQENQVPHARPSISTDSKKDFTGETLSTADFPLTVTKDRIGAPNLRLNEATHSATSFQEEEHTYIENKGFFPSSTLSKLKDAFDKTDIQLNPLHTSLGVEREASFISDAQISTSEFQLKATSQQHFLENEPTHFGFPAEEQPILRLSRLPIIGQAFRTYIMLEEKDKLWLVDQHAAHEKILFEKLYANFKSGKQQVQPLLIPMDIELKQSDKQCLFMHQEMFKRLGYEFEDFGAQSIILRAVPASQQQMDPLLSLLAVLDYLQNEHEIEREDWLDHQAYDILAEVACKAAIKGNDNLGLLEQKALLEELETLEQPYNCPHGRPIVIMISKYELEKKFKRIL